MKKKHGLERALSSITRTDLRALPTGALLARLERLHWCEEAAEGSDLTREQVESAADLILFKDGDAWRARPAPTSKRSWQSVSMPGTSHSRTGPDVRIDPLRTF
jgi:hypothetical protein